MVREGLRRLVEDEEAFSVVGEAAEGDEAISLVRRLRPDVVVLDPAVPGLNGAPLVVRLVEYVPAGSIIVLSQDGHDAPEDYRRLGVAAYITKASSARELIAVIRAAAFSDTPRSAREPGWLRDRPTARELDVLRLVALGLTNREIAVRLAVTQRTVQYHLAQIFAKLGATSRTQAVHLSRERDWME